MHHAHDVATVPRFFARQRIGHAEERTCSWSGDWIRIFKSQGGDDSLGEVTLCHVKGPIIGLVKFDAEMTSKVVLVVEIKGMPVGECFACFGIDEGRLQACECLVNGFLGFSKEDTIVTVNGEDCVTAKVKAWVKGAGTPASSFKTGFEVLVPELR